MLNTNCLANELAKSEGLSQKASLKLVKSILDIMTKSLAKQETVKLTGFGQFKVKNKTGNLGPKKFSVNVVHFSASKTLKAKVK